MQSIEQQRAKFALDGVIAVRDGKKVDSKEFKSYANSLPPMVLMNGLGQTAAFIKAKGSKSESYEAHYDLLSRWLTGEGGDKEQPYGGCGNLLVGITCKDMDTYRLAQTEALALLVWVKQFANALLEIDDPTTKNAEDGNG